MVKILRGLFAGLFLHLRELLFGLVVELGELPIFGAVVYVQVHQLSIINRTHLCDSMQYSLLNSLIGIPITTYIIYLSIKASRCD
jgi:hypothetical protein